MALHLATRGRRNGPLFCMVAEGQPQLDAMASSNDVFQHFRADAQADREWFQALYLNPKNKVIRQVLEFVGTADSSMVAPREIARHALMLGAAAVIVCHNHPSGDPEPSLNDRELTRDLFRALSLFQIKLLDHIIIGAKINGEQAYRSLADQGLMDEYAAEAWLGTRS